MKGEPKASQIIIDIIKEKLAGKRKITFYVGAGLLNGSGIPTFKGDGAYWTKGMEYARAEDMATIEFFNQNPEIAWGWFLDRLQLCNFSKPNEGHEIIEKFNHLFPERFNLISQNYCGLHDELNIEKEKIHLVHGDMNKMRCVNNCKNVLYDLPEKLKYRKHKKGELSSSELELIKCANCGGIYRPNVLMIDEKSNEKYYKLITAQSIIKKSALIFIIGVKGNSRISHKIIDLSNKNSSLVINIDPRSNLLTYYMRSGCWITGKVERVLPEIFNQLKIGK